MSVGQKLLRAKGRALAQHWAVRYSAALAVTLLALGLMLLLTPVQESPFLFFFAAVVVSARYAGFGPALLSIGLSAVLADHFFMPPLFDVHKPGELTRLAAFVATSAFIAVVAKQRRQAAARASEIQTRMAAIVESSQDAIISRALDGTITSWNRGAEQLYGFSVAEALGKPVAVIVPPERRHEILDSTERLRRGEALDAIETERLAKDGRRIQVLITFSPLRHNGELTGVSTISRDITAQKLAEENLRKSEARFRAIFEHAGIGVMIASPEGILLETNRVLQQMLGYSAAHLRGRHYAEITHTDSLESSRALIEEFLRSGRDVLHVEKKYVRIDGRSIWGKLTISPVRDAAGQALFTVGIIEDITESKRADQELRASEERLRCANEALAASEQRLKFAQKSADMGAWEWNVKSGELWWSDGIWLLHGFALGTLEPTFENWISRVLAEDRVRVQKAIEDALAGRPGYAIDYRSVWPDGSLHWIEARGEVLFDAHGKPDVMIGIGIDISERKRGEEAMRRTEKLAATGRLAATIAHEINNPLEAITNLLYLAKSDPSLSGEARHYLTAADQELRRVAHIARQTLGFYKESVAPLPVRLSTILEDVLALYERRLDGTAIRLEKRYDAEATVMGFQGELRQVFSNLVANAIDAMPEGGALKLKISRERLRAGGPGVRVLIADSGIGIEPERLARIFEPFYTTKKDVGTGLGLWITQNIVQKHGGAIRVRSRTGLGRSGTVVSVFLPGSAAEELKSAQIA